MENDLLAIEFSFQSLEVGSTLSQSMLHWVMVKLLHRVEQSRFFCSNFASLFLKDEDFNYIGLDW